MATKTVDPKLAAPWPVPVGWTYTYVDGPGIERKVGKFELSIADETDTGHGWSWWVTREGHVVSARSGHGEVSVTEAIINAANAMFDLAFEGGEA